MGRLSLTDSAILISLAVGGLLALLIALAYPLAIYYGTGLAPVETYAYTVGWLYKFFGVYIIGQAAAVGALAALISYAKSAGIRLTGKAAQSGRRLGFGGALLGGFVSLFYICCSPLMVGLLAAAASLPLLPTLLLIRYNDELALGAIAVQAAAVAVMAVTIRRREIGARCATPSRARGDVRGSAKHGSKSACRQALVVALLGLAVLGVALYTAFIPEPQFVKEAQARGEEAFTGLLEVHVVDAHYNPLPASVRISGPIIQQLEAESGTVDFFRLKPADYRVEVITPGRLPAVATVRVSEAEPTHVVFVFTAEGFRVEDEF